MGDNESGKRDRAESHYRSTLDELGEHLRQRRIELGVTQEDMASSSGLKQWDISRIEGGKFPRDPAALRLIAQGYRFDRQHILEVVYGFKPETNYFNPLLVAYRLHEQQVYHQRTGGRPQLAIDQGIQVVTELRQAIRQTGSSDATLAAGLGDSLVGILTEVGWAYSETSGWRKDWFEKSPFMRHLQETDEELGIPEIETRQLLFHMDSSYVGGRYPESIAYGQQALGRLTDLDMRLQAHKTLLMDWAFLGDETLYLETARTIWGLLNKRQYYHSELAGSILQGLIRSAVMLDMPEEAWKASKAFKRLLKGMRERGLDAPFRRSQYIHAELVRVNRYERKRNESLLRAGRRDYRLVRKWYPRLGEEIREALES